MARWPWKIWIVMMMTRGKSGDRQDAGAVEEGVSKRVAVSEVLAREGA